MSRKYRHQGYQDNGSERRGGNDEPPPRRDSLTTEERIHRKGLRHAIDRDAQEVIRCHQCGRNIQQFGTITRSSGCPHCNAPLHCCRSCRQFDVGARWQCRAPIETAVSDKSKANECSHYEPRLVLDTTGRRSASGPKGSGGAREQFENLFRR